MKRNTENQFAVEAGQTTPGTHLESCRKLVARINRARASIASEFREKLARHQHVLELVLNEAEALAWQTDFPQLFFPTLAVEKASALASWDARQQSMLRRMAPPAVAA